MVAADWGVSPAVTNEPKARLVEVISPARSAEKSNAAAGSNFSLSSSARIAPRGLSKEWSTCRKLSRIAVPVPRAATRAGGIPHIARIECSKRSLNSAKRGAVPWDCVTALLSARARLAAIN